MKQATVDRRLEKMERIFQALGDATRLRILGLLARGETCVCDIHESLKIAQPKTSRHLAYLRRAGLVEDRKKGLWVYYRLAQPEDPVTKTMIAAVTHALGHLPGAEADRRRLAHRRGGLEPEPACLPGLPCCGPAVRE